MSREGSRRASWRRRRGRLTIASTGARRANFLWFHQGAFPRLGTRNPRRVGSIGERVADRVIGLDNVKNAAVMLRVPGDQANIELVQFLTPADGGILAPRFQQHSDDRHPALRVAVDEMNLHRPAPSDAVTLLWLNSGQSDHPAARPPALSRGVAALDAREAAIKMTRCEHAAATLAWQRTSPGRRVCCAPHSSAPSCTLMTDEVVAERLLDYVATQIAKRSTRGWYEAKSS